MTTTDTVRTARAAGLAYLGLAVTGMLGFLVVRPQLYTADAAETLANLAGEQSLAHTAVLLEMGVVVTQALAAVWFYRLLRDVRPVAAFAIAAFGLMNSAAIMASGAFMIAATAIAGDPSIVAGADAAGTVGALGALSTATWGMGTVFFGLWLIPMGWAALTTRRFPVTLGWLLIVGGSGYLISGLVGYGFAGSPEWLVTALGLPATAAEFWMIGYLLVAGIRPRAHATVAAAPATVGA
ncbi:DUF4386 domain-containing protein [Demequina aestuarii]|uniref:DUF4386 domain-containing protein n=1 Tax=Demequina aestuarii TaxID=327095 RepID=UPI0007836A7D|nr:DUF4386 domain-containing protein [Demequina aestuarii]